MTNLNVACLNGLIQCVDEPVKVLMLSQLHTVGPSSIPDISRGIDYEADGENLVIPQHIRSFMDPQFRYAGVVKSEGLGSKYYPQVWELTHNFYGHLGMASLHLMDITNRPTTHYFGTNGHSKSFRKSRFRQRPQLLEHASKGTLDNCPMGKWRAEIQVQPCVFYNAARQGLIDCIDGSYFVSDEASLFLDVLYQPIKEFVAGKINRFPQSKKLDSNKSLSELYNTALSFD